MTEPAVVTEPAADLALESAVLGASAAFAAVGVLALVTTALVAERPWVVLVSSLVGVLVASGTAWGLGNLVGRHRYDDLRVASGPRRGSGSRAARAGALRGLFALVVGAGVLLVESLGISDDADLYVVGGAIPLGFSCVALLYRRDLLRWQARHQVVVCTAVGARRFAWTRAQARAQLVVIPSRPSDVMRPGRQGSQNG